MRSDIPARLDALPFTAWHRRVVLALGITWILDGLEASLVANLGPTLGDERTLGLRAAEVGFANTTYLVGQVVGALVFGALTDRWGRKRLFLVTLALYLGATGATGLAHGYGTFLVLRFFAGAGIGGEYSAMNSAIDELVPARLRGRVDLAINGSYWVGVALGGLLTLALLDAGLVPITLAWRLAFGLGALLGLGVLVLRKAMPESPRWLLTRGRVEEAEATMADIERHAVGHPAHEGEHTITETRVEIATFREIARSLFVRYRRRSVLGLTLMVAQAFFYNAIFFSYGLILERFHGVAKERVGLYVLPFAVGNFLGPLLLGPLFDRLGRRFMIPLTYGLSGLTLLATGVLFLGGMLNAVSQTVAWCVVFFFASSAASSAYLTVSELYPVHVRGVAIAVFYAIATGAGAIAPSVFGAIVEAENRERLFAGYTFASLLMIGAALVARKLAVASEGKSLESLAEEP